MHLSISHNFRFLKVLRQNGMSYLKNIIKYTVRNLFCWRTQNEFASRPAEFTWLRATTKKSLFSMDFGLFCLCHVSHCEITKCPCLVANWSQRSQTRQTHLSALIAKRVWIGGPYIQNDLKTSSSAHQNQSRCALSLLSLSNLFYVFPLNECVHSAAFISVHP